MQPLQRVDKVDTLDGGTRHRFPHRSPLPHRALPLTKYHFYQDKNDISTPIKV